MAKFRFIILSFIFCSILLFEFLFLFVLPNKLDINKCINPIMQKISSNHHINIEVENPTFDTFSDMTINLKFDKIQILKSDKELFSARDLNTRIFLPSLIFKKINLKTISAEEINIALKRNSKGFYNLDGLDLNFHNKNIKFKISNAKMFLKQYNINFKDDFYKKNFAVNGDYLFINKFKQDKFIDIAATGTLIQNKKATPFEFAISSKYPILKNIDKKGFKCKLFVNNINLNLFSEYIKEYLDKDLNKMSGYITADIKTVKDNNKNKIKGILVLDDINYERERKDYSVYASGKNIINFETIAKKNNLYIEKFNYNNDILKFDVNGIIKSFNNYKKAKLNLKANLTEGRSEKLYWLLPSEIRTEQDMIRKVKKYGFYSDVKGKLDIKGKLLKPQIFGNAEIKNAYVGKELKKHIPKAVIDLIFKGEELNVKAKVYTDKDEYVIVDGDALIYGFNSGAFEISSTENVDLSIAQSILLPVHDVFMFELGPLPIMKVSGFGNIKLSTNGTVKNPILNGIFKCHDATASFNDLNTELKNASAELKFEGKNLSFKTLKGFIAKTPVEITGICDFDGNLDFNAKANDFNAGELINILKTSPMIKDFVKNLELIKDASGNIDFNLNLKGKIKHFDIEAIQKYLKYSGDATLKNIKAHIQNINTPVTDINGKINFEQEKVDAKFTSKLLDGKMESVFLQDKNNISLKTKMDKFDISNSVNFLKTFPEYKDLIPVQGLMNADITYSSNIDKIDFSKLNMNANFISKQYFGDAPLYIKNGIIQINNGNLSIKDVNMKSFNSNIKLSGNAKNIFNKKMNSDLKINFDNFELRNIKKLNEYSLFEKRFSKLISLIDNYNGVANGELEYKNNKLNGKIFAGNVIFKSQKILHPMVIGNLFAKIENNNLKIKPFTLNFENTPIFIDMSVNSILNKPSLDMYVSSNFSPILFDDFINNYLTYPVKLKGEMLFSTKIKGNYDGLNIDTTLKLDEGADLTYLGANLGDINDFREIYSNLYVNKNILDIKKFEYTKFIKTQNNRQNPMPMFRSSGKILKQGNSYTLNPLALKTYSSTSAKLFNILFKKSIIKQGLFDCDLVLKGNAYNPDVVGNAKLYNVEMPSYEAKIKELNVNLTPNDVNLFALINAYGSDAEIKAKMVNSNKQPIVIDNFELNSKYINIDKLEHSLTKITYSDYAKYRNKNNDFSNLVDISSFIVKKGHIKANDILIKGLNATNFSMDFNLDRNMLLKTNPVTFNLANGKVFGNLSYNFSDTSLEADFNAENVSAEPVARAILQLDNQIYGNMSGKANVKTKGHTDEDKIKNLNGVFNFEISDGKMPKLGALEYLLKAGNLIQSGITGITLNSIIQLVTPMKTGEFKKIKGRLDVENGIAKNIEIFSQGKDLNIFLKGKIDLMKNYGEIYVFGRLSKSANTILGVIGNASLNSLFALIPGINLNEPQNAFLLKEINKIPGIELSSQKYRLFRAVIDGDISGEEYVKSFEWVN